MRERAGDGKADLISASEGLRQQAPLTDPLPAHRRPAIRGALRGSLALLSRGVAAQQQALPAPTPAAALELVRTAVGHVFIRALAAPDRQLALRLLAAAMQGYGQALMEANLDLLEYTVSSGGCGRGRVWAGGWAGGLGWAGARSLAWGDGLARRRLHTVLALPHRAHSGRREGPALPAAQL